MKLRKINATQKLWAHNWENVKINVEVIICLIVN